jgi:hypothetical protein
MGKTDETVVVETTITEGKSKKSEKGFTVVDPINELNLGEHAYKVVQADMADTEKNLRALGLNYYHIKGGEVVKKGFNKDRTKVIFNEDLPDQFEIAIEEEQGVLVSSVDRYYSKHAQAVAICKALSEAELEKTKKQMQEWEEARNLLMNQIEEEKF